MVLNQMQTNRLFGGPIKSAGMFYFNAFQGSKQLNLRKGKIITVAQPLNGQAVDGSMRAMNYDSSYEGGNYGWIFPPRDSSGFGDTLSWTATNYIYYLFYMNFQSDMRTWCNSDNPNFFTVYPQTILTFRQSPIIGVYNSDMYLVFNEVNSVVHVYGDSVDFQYSYAPVGLKCTAVVIGIKDGKVYSSFVPLTINENMIVNFSLSETTTNEFKRQLNALN